MVEKVEKVEKVKSGEISGQKWRNLCPGYPQSAKIEIWILRDIPAKMIGIIVHDKTQR